VCPGRGRCPGRVPAVLPITDTTGGSDMRMTTNARTPASTFLSHFFGGGLIDKGECYLLERFRAMSNGEIRR